ncbi:MAG: flagellar motor switch protein FliN [Synergistales bacterium]
MGSESEEAMREDEPLRREPVEGASPMPAAGEGMNAAEPAGLSAEEIDALTRGLDGLEAIGSKVPDIPDLEHFGNPSMDGDPSQASIDDLIASIKANSSFNFEAPAGETPSLPSVKPVVFPEIEPGGRGDTASVTPARLDLLMDIPVRISVVLGRTQMTLGEIMTLEPGGVIELEKLVGDPIEVLANGKLILRGEVVVIDENFGVRVTEVVDPCSRRGVQGKG